MRLSRKGTWIFDNPEFGYLVKQDTCEIFRIVSYSYGFNNMEFFYQKPNGKYSNTTVPRNFIKRNLFSCKYKAMSHFVKLHMPFDCSVMDKRLFNRLTQYAEILKQKHPELLS